MTGLGRFHEHWIFGMKHDEKQPLVSRPEHVWNACMVVGSILVAGIILLMAFVMAVSR